MREVRWPILLAILCLGLYSNSLNNSFHYDDVHSIVNNINLWESASLSDFGERVVMYFDDPGMFSVDPNKGMYRPVLLVTYLLNFQFGDGTVWGFHVANLLVHILNVCFVYWLSLLLTGRHGSARVASMLLPSTPSARSPSTISAVAATVLPPCSTWWASACLSGEERERERRGSNSGLPAPWRWGC